MRTRVKICGITRAEDARAAISCGADAIGLVFYPPSPRFVTPQQARAITACLPPFVTVVGLFVNAQPDFVAEAVSEAGIDLIQFHGDELPDVCRSQGRPWVKGVRMKEGLDLAAVAERYTDANALLLDAYRPGVPGGTGDIFDWARIPAELAGKIILAGGLTPQNVTSAVQQVRPYAVDVSGGVEVTPGVKDAGKIETFIRGVKLGEQ